jgi:hypothetical protein
VAQKRIAACEAIPLPGGNAGERIDDFYRHFRAVLIGACGMFSACVSFGVQSCHDDILAT